MTNIFIYNFNFQINTTIQHKKGGVGLVDLWMQHTIENLNADV